MASLVENTLRAQRGYWSEIMEGVARSSTELPPEHPKRILLFGLGSSYFAAKLTYYAMLRDAGARRIPVIACPSLRIGREVLPHRDDWAIAFTHRAGKGPTMDALNMCNTAGAFTGIITSREAAVPDSVKYVLRTVPQETIEPHTASMTGAICAATSLLIGNRAMEEWDALRGLRDPDLEQMREIAGKGPSTLLGEWEGEYLAREGALKLMEMARLPVRAFSSEEYFHGPRFSNTKSDVFWHIAMAKDPRAEQIAELSRAVHRIQVFGGTPLAWVPALLELQWLALATAINLGVDPDAV